MNWVYKAEQLPEILIVCALENLGALNFEVSQNPSWHSEKSGHYYSDIFFRRKLFSLELTIR